MRPLVAVDDLLALVHQGPAHLEQLLATQLIGPIVDRARLV